MIIRSQMTLIMCLIRLEPQELPALEFGKIAIFDFVYTLASTNVNRLTPNLVKMYMIIRSCVTLIMCIIRPEQLELSALEFGITIIFEIVYILASNDLQI